MAGTSKKNVQYETTSTDWPYYVTKPNDIYYRPSFNSSSMTMAGNLKGNLADIKQRGLFEATSAAGQEALRKGPSAWAGLAMDQQRQQALDALNQGAAGIAGDAATARSQLAMKGGLDSGGAQSIARQAMKNSLDMNQDVTRQFNNNALQIGMNDEQNRLRMLEGQTGREYQALQPQIEMQKLGAQADQFDINNKINEGVRRNEFDLSKWQTDMAGWAANKSAQATAESGKK